MAVTRIKNNQITDASNGNTQLGVNAAVKLQNYSVTAGKLANSLVYGSDLTVSGNLTVNGTTTTVDTINTLIKDPILVLADGQTAGTPTVDIGILGYRGNQNSSFLGWQETGQTFMAILSNTTVSNTTVNVSSYANFTASTIIAQANLSVIGNIVGTANFTGNVNAGNLLTPGLISATGNATVGNMLTGGLISATGNATAGNVLTGGLISATGNVTGGNVITGGLISATGTITATANISGGNILTGGIISATGNLAAGNISTAGNVTASYFIGNISGNIDAAGSNTEIQFNTVGDILGANANFTYDFATNLMTVNGGNIATGNLSATGQVVATGNATAGNVLTGGLVSATGNATAGNVLTGGLVSATGNITTAGALNGATLSLSGNVTSALNVTGNTTSGNLLTPGIVSATGNATAGNVLTGGLVSATANVTGGNILTAGLISAGGNITSATNVNTPNVVGASGLTLSTGGNANILLEPAGTGNIIINNRYINGLQLTPLQDADAASKYYVDTIATTGLTFHEAVFATTNANLATATGGAITYTQPNGAANGIGALITTTGTFTTIDTANVQTLGTRILVKDEANAVLNGVYTWANATNIVRSIDTDQYGASSTESFSINDYFFTTNGNVNAGAAFVVDAPAGVITFGTSNISFAQFSSSQTYTANVSAGLVLVNQQFNAKVDNNTTAFDGGGNISVKAGANLTTPNIGAATGTSLSVTGDVTANTNISAVGNVIGGNVLTGGLISATGNATAGNINTAGLASVTGNVIAGNVTTAGLISATGNVTGGNVISSALVQGVTVSATGNVIGGNVSTAGLVTATGNVTGGNINTAGLASVTGNVIGGNVSTAGLVTATGNVTGGNINTAGLASVTGNVIGGNILTGGLISATGNITGANINGTVYGNVNATTVSATGNVTGGNVLTGGEVSATGNATAGNVLTGGLISATSTITSAANITGGNILTGGLVSATGTGTFGNIVLTGDFINQLQANSIINVNGASANTNFAVNGTTANLIYVNATTNTVGVGNNATIVNAIASFNAVTSIVLPTGTLGQRPSNASSQTGMIRFNTTNNGIEIYDNSEWTSVGGTTFTVIADEQFNGDGSTVAFTLVSSQTTNSCIVSINGVVQIPTSAYSVAGTDPTCVLTFTEAPAAGDLIDVREITTTTTVTAISNNSGNAEITGDSTSAAMTVLGNLVPTANVTYNLGSATNYWKSLYVGGNTIYLGGLQLQSAAGNVFNVFASDGTTPATFGNFSTGTANVSGGNILTTGIMSSTGNATHGNLSVGTGTITVGNVVNGNGNGVGNIGSSGTYFNTIFAKATSAQYADLAEKYVADSEYAPGTVVSFGGDKEVTRSEIDADRRVAGVVSTNPSYIMNAALEAEHVAVVAFTGRVPTSVTGTVAKGDLMVSNGDGTARAEHNPRAGAIIGKALENFEGATGVIEVVIGRF
jgi:filamentous hemagglutinin